ncbi:hypothetical protein SFHH103_psfHH103d_574 (plasmid) [Sinorhizobium fredii HH103]|nr:hypothetical protein SFHH103_04623 [Sinorhizobium fredii HH103]CEO91781.1 hypothetical protein SFHH103_psfHH103d_574 [Sinorhizobium fredii HH103]
MPRAMERYGNFAPAAEVVRSGVELPVLAVDRLPCQ